MPVEISSNIAGLDASWPLSNDPRSEGDNHIRNIKDTLKKQFPGALGGGFDKPIIATEDELNFSEGLLGNIQDQFDVIVVALQNGLNTVLAPEGTLLLFGKLPPIGWTVQNYGSDRMIRIIDTTLHNFNAGGSSDPIHYNGGHTHALNIAGIQVQSGTGSIVADTPTAEGGNDWNPRYVAACVGIKDPY